MARIRIVLMQKKKPTAQGYMLYYYCRYAGGTYFRSTGYRCLERDWNQRQATVRASHPGGKRLQEYLKQELIRRQQRLEEAERRGLPFPQAWQERTELPTFSEHARELMAQLWEAGSLGNYRIYQAGLKNLETWHGGPVPMELITYPTLRKFLAHLDGRGYAYHSIRQLFSTLKAIWHDAARSYPEQLGGDPFAGLLQGRRPERTAARQVQHQSLETIRRLAQLKDLPPGRQLAVDAWLLAFALQGAGNIDVIYFQPNLIDAEGYYPLKRLKMPRKNVLVRVKLQPLAGRIVERYQRPDATYLLPLVKVPRDDNRLLQGRLPEGTRQYENARHRLRNRLRDVSKLLDLERPLRMSQARHSWVVAAREMGASKELVQQAIGHQGQDVLSQHYWGAFEQNRVDELNAQILKGLEGAVG